MQYPKGLIRFLIIDVTVIAGALFLVTSVVAQELVVENLIVNGDFPDSTAGWIEEDTDHLSAVWSSWDANDSQNSGSFWGKARGERVVSGSEGFTKGVFGWQCLNVAPGRRYRLATDVQGYATDGNASYRRTRLYLKDLGGESCPTSSVPIVTDSITYLEHTLEIGSEGTQGEWVSKSTSFQMPTDVTSLAVKLHICCGYNQDFLDNTEPDEAVARYDNIVLGELRPDISVDLVANDTQLDVGEEFDINLELDSQDNGFDAEIRVFHDDRLELVGSTCEEGSVIDAQQGDDHYFQWFGISGGANSYSRSCTITARAKPGFDDVFTLFAQGWCNDCGDDIDIFNNVDSVDLAFLPAPDIGVQEVSLSEFPQPGEEMTLDIVFHNHGTKLATSNVSVGLVPMPVFHTTDTGNCAGFAFSGGEVSGLIFASPGETVECTISFTAQESWAAGTLVATVSTITTLDYNANNDTRVDSTRIVDLLVNRSIDGWDGSPGDGVCESSSGNDDCSLRAAVMEANALAAATGRTFTVKVPYSPFSYTLTRTSGDESSLHGSIKINRRMRLLGIPDQDGNLPFVVGSFPSADADRLIRIGNPASFVRIENMHLQGQGLVPTDTDGQGTDGGLILHRSGALHLTNVTLADGATDGRGGAIYSASDDTNGDLNLEGVRVFDNQAVQGGGLAFVPESGLTALRLEESEVYSNQAQTGGGIFAADVHATALPAVSIKRSTLHENHALGGGGAAWLNGVMLASIDNSTISGNVAEIAGGGIGVIQDTPLAINNSTVAFNQARPGDDSDGLGGGLYLTGDATITLYNSIVSSNTAKEACSTPNPPFPAICVPQAANCYGTVNSAGYNAMSGDSECAFNSEPSDATSQVQLEPLADNGGSTLTHSPAAFAWIVDAGDPACLERPGGDPLNIDQRGALRPFDGDETGGAQCDRGAYELSDSARVTVMVDDAALGQVQSSPTGIWCGAGTNDSCSALFGFEAEVTLTATVNSGSGGEFIGWQGDCTGQGNPCTFAAAGDVETTAVFALVDQPDFLLSCEGDNIIKTTVGPVVDKTCNVASVNGYAGTVNLVCNEEVTSLDCQLSPDSVTLPADGSQSFTLTIDTGTTAPGLYAIIVEGADGSKYRQVYLALDLIEEAVDRMFSDRFEQ